MEQQHTTDSSQQNESNNPQTQYQWGAAHLQPKSNLNKALLKVMFTGFLTLLLLIPTVFVSNLVSERQNRQQQVVQEVKQGWASEQTVYGPYLYLPYKAIEKDINDKETIVTKAIYILPENLKTTGNIVPEIRQRSIYNVLLYKSNINSSGNFKLQLPEDVNKDAVLWNEAKICLGLTDLKGVEDKPSLTCNNVVYDLQSGLPLKQYEQVEKITTSDRVENNTKNIELQGLSSKINITPNELQQNISFALNIKVKGSEQLHFIPLSSNSSYALQSSWANPKFDGSDLPNSRDVTNKGFTAQWNFTAANLPYGTVLKDYSFNKHRYAFGVSMLQPTDHYAKTLRSVKYAILFIGLTFALFFIIEIMQKKPMHPVQYILIGLALVIFFTLLLSISEFLFFDIAYIIAAAATILLITLYAKAHFKSNKSASVFATFLTGLYSFIFVLIRLEDAALLVGSIGLFVILAAVMYASRKINWYNG